MMCAWCGAGFVPQGRGASDQFCSLRCRRKNVIFHAKRALSDLQRTQFRHVLDNWRSLPKSRRKRVVWLKNGIRSAAVSAKSAVSNATSGRAGAASTTSRPAVTPRVGSQTVPSEVDVIAEQETQTIDLVASPWNGQGIVDLVSVESADEATTFSCDQTIDRTTWLEGGRSWRFSVSEAATAITKFPDPLEGGEALDGATGFGVSVFLPEPENITDLGLWVFASNGGRYRWSTKNAAAPRLHRGWNHLRFDRTWTEVPLENPTWGDISAVQLYVAANADTSFNLGKVWAETRPKASLLFIHDGGYLGFDQSPGYRDLRSRGVPVTWAVDCALIGDSSHVTRDRLIEVGNENGNSISFHGWDGAVSNEYTSAEQAREETSKCQKWVSDLPTSGNTGSRWRAAWMQNRSPFSPATDDMVELNPMWDPVNKPPKGPVVWPLANPHSYRREALHHLSARDLRELFEEAKQTHGVLICYTHNVGDGITNISPELWAEFLALVDEGLEEGWLEGVTFETLTSDDRGIED